MKNKIEYPVVVHLEAILMENGEVIHYGKSLGFINDKQKELVEMEATKLARGNEVVIALNDKMA